MESRVSRPGNGPSRSPRMTPGPAIVARVLLDWGRGTRRRQTDECRGCGGCASEPRAPSSTGRVTARVTFVGMTPQEIADLVCLRRARDLIDRKYAEPLDVPAIARTALMSPAHFSRKFRAAYGETPYSYLMTRRIERAKALLRQGDRSVTEVCLAVGCTSLGSFSARFTQLTGETPTAYRARDHGELVAVPGCIAKELTRPSNTPSRIREALGAPAR